MAISGITAFFFDFRYPSEGFLGGVDSKEQSAFYETCLFCNLLSIAARIRQSVSEVPAMIRDVL
jgi:hypothetical protein